MKKQKKRKSEKKSKPSKKKRVKKTQKPKITSQQTQNSQVEPVKVTEDKSAPTSVTSKSEASKQLEKIEEKLQEPSMADVEKKVQAETDKKPGFFSKLKFKLRNKKKDDAVEEDKEEKKEDEANQESTQEEPKVETVNPSGGGGVNGSVSADIERIKAQLESLKEMRNVFSERFTRFSEQIGELRSMILQSIRSSQEMEARAVKAIGLIEEIKPDKVMMEVRRQDQKLEALRLLIDTNDAKMERVGDELKDLRNKFSFFKGIDQVVKLDEEVKNELINIKKIEVAAENSADKVQTIFMEMQKRFKDLEIFKDQFNAINLTLKQLSKDTDELKIKLAESAKKEELDKLVTKIMNNIKKVESYKKSKTEFDRDLNAVKDLVAKGKS